MTDEGSGTVWVLVCVLVLVAAAGLSVTGGFVAVERHRAAAVADESALAGAARLLQGVAAACGAAAKVAAASGGVLVDCAPAPGPSVEVVVDVPPAGLLSGWPSARVRARAGPGPPASGQQAGRVMRG